MVKRFKITFRKAAELCGVPVSTIYFKVHQRSNVGCHNGAPHTLSDECRQVLVAVLQVIAAERNSVNLSFFKSLVGILMNKYGIFNFRGSLPGRNWYCRFLNQNGIPFEGFGSLFRYLVFYQ